MVFRMIEEARTGQPVIIVVSDDTDVILAHRLCSSADGLPQDVVITMHSRSASAAVIDANEVIKAHKNITPNPLCAHARTSCDTVSSLSGIRKVTVKTKKATVFQRFAEAWRSVGIEGRDHRVLSPVHSSGV